MTCAQGSDVWPTRPEQNLSINGPHLPERQLTQIYLRCMESHLHQVASSNALVQAIHVASGIRFANCTARDFCKSVVEPNDHVPADMTERLEAARIRNRL